MTRQARTITLSSDQLALLDLLVSAAVVEPDAPFGCGRLRRVGFTWIIHDGFLDDVRVANWDDVLALDQYGLLDLHISDDDPDDCSFVLTELARVIHNQYGLEPRSSGAKTFSFDVEQLRSG